jgi:hypothetical protein
MAHDIKNAGQATFDFGFPSIEKAANQLRNLSLLKAIA